MAFFLDFSYFNFSLRDFNSSCFFSNVFSCSAVFASTIDLLPYLTRSSTYS
nr:MAG TPA: hypothetical protein [Crassvirales sp.]